MRPPFGWYSAVSVAPVQCRCLLILIPLGSNSARSLVLARIMNRDQVGLASRNLEKRTHGATLSD
uniref:Uncharacterized protein n=1 Tax=Arundo donax TaxID=35708 RepID=A0A0A9E4S4_ARUDO